MKLPVHPIFGRGRHDGASRTRSGEPKASKRMIISYCAPGSGLWGQAGAGHLLAEGLMKMGGSLVVFKVRIFF